MFIPATGYYRGTYSYNIDSICYLWTSNLYLDKPNYAYHAFFSSDMARIYNDERYFGYNIRPVINL